MNRHGVLSVVVLAVLVLGMLSGVGGCGFGAMGNGMGGGGRMAGMPRDMDMDRIEKKQDLMQKLMADPQIPAWHTAREKITLALGDRVFDKGFDEVFNGIVVALPTLEANINNMEKSSGYITCAVPRLNPERARQLQRAGMEEYAQANGYDPSLLDKKGPYEMDLESIQGFSRMGQAMTISLVKQGPQQTKVKIRFSNVNYPAELQEYYKVVWPAIDKQIFMDKSTD